ncbi:MAG TPA: tRNA dihydrouridine synthase DusB [Candidatus Eisenbacteria bacterium]|nr:tRNA dihydrouridine synthase DusB [Candidatus Eisenbacteria bacterium]
MSPIANLRPLQLGTLTLESQVMLAPLAGVSDAPFRLLCREQGAASVCTELVSADGLVRGNRKTLRYLHFYPAERPMGVQLFGSDPAVMAEACRIVCDLPEEVRPDFVDLNIGCPVHKVVTREAGAALLCNLPLLEDVVKAVVEASTLPVTAKTRCGWDNSHQNGVEVTRLFEGAGVVLVAMHARTRSQGFEGRANWDMIRDAQAAVSIPVVGNGDVTTAAEAVRMLEETEAAGVMIGRAAFGNPWIFRETRALLDHGRGLAPATPRERMAGCLRQLALLTEVVGESVAVREMRKHVAWYLKGLPRAAAVKESANRATTAAEIEELLMSYLDRLENGSAAVLDARPMEEAWPEPVEV